jgi:superfamily II DNA or RNA helicase
MCLFLYEYTMALTIHGYRVSKTEIENLTTLKGRLTVKPYVPAVFVNPRFVQKYAVFKESTDVLYLPKHFGIGEFGPYTTTTRNASQTSDIFWEFTGSLRDIQVDVVNSFLKPEPHDGLICLQTGGGKTVCALYIAAQLKLPTLVLVHNTFLRDQWIERIKAFLPNARVGIFQGAVQQVEDVDIVVGMLQSICMKEISADTFKNIGFVIVDECHHIASEAFSQAVPKITSKYMLGLSATPERKDKLMHVIHWFLGPLLYKSDSSDKVDPGVFVEVYEFEEGDDKFNEVIYNNQGVMFSSLMVNKLVDFEPRNKMIVTLLEDVCDEKERQVLVLSDRVDHCQLLFDMLPTHSRETACVLSRKTDSKTRAEWCETKRILIATYQMCKEGFDVATLNTLVIATPRPDVDQIVGRILRVEKTKRTVSPLIIDIVDPAFRRQFQERLSLYNKRDYKVEKMKIA